MKTPIACLRPKTSTSTGDAAAPVARSLWGLRPQAAPHRNASGTQVFWKAKWGSVPLALDLHLLCPGTRRPDLPAAGVAFELPEGLSARVRAFARAEMTQVFSVMLAAWQVLLFRHTTQGEFFVGCAAPGGRSSVPDQPMLLPAALTRDTTFRAAVRAAAASRAETCAAPIARFEDALPALRATVTPTRHPVFQTAFIQRLAVGESLTRAVARGRHAPCDLACVWADAGPMIRGRIEYPAGIMTPDTADCLAARLVNLVRAALVLPDAPVSALPIQSLAEYDAASA